jgi:hypothetical protein
MADTTNSMFAGRFTRKHDESMQIVEWHQGSEDHRDTSEGNASRISNCDIQRVMPATLLTRSDCQCLKDPSQRLERLRSSRNRQCAASESDALRSRSPTRTTFLMAGRRMEHTPTNCRVSRNASASTPTAPALTALGRKTVLPATQKNVSLMNNEETVALANQFSQHARNASLSESWQRGYNKNKIPAGVGRSCEVFLETCRCLPSSSSPCRVFGWHDRPLETKPSKYISRRDLGFIRPRLFATWWTELLGSLRTPLSGC